MKLTNRITYRDLKRAGETLNDRVRDMFPDLLREGEVLEIPPKDFGGYRIQVLVPAPDLSMGRRYNAAHPALNLFPDMGALGTTAREAYEKIRSVNTVLLYAKRWNNQ